MKKHKTLLITLISVIAMLFCSAWSVSSATDDALVVGVPADRCPIFYIDNNTNEISGIGVDLMRTAAEEAGYTPEFRVIKEETLKDALDNDEYDVVMPFGSALESTSGKATVVSDNLLQTPFTFVTVGEHGLPSLNYLHVGMLKSLGAGAETVNQLYPDIRITLYDTMDESVKALRAGEVDALLHNSYVWSYVLQKPAYSDLVVQPSTVFSMDFRAGTQDTPKGREVIKRLNDGIASITDTQRQAIVLDYTSRDLYKYDFSDYFHKYGLIILLAVLLFASLIVIATQKVIAVRKEHEEKLRELIDHDPLTGLLSMSGFRKRVEELLRTYPDTPYFLSYNNIRDFKFINDSLGRDAGDALLKFWAEKSLENLSDQEAMGRVDADHFAVLRRIEGEEKMHEDEKNVFDPVQNFFIDQGKDNIVKISSGIYVLTPKDFRNIDVDHMLDLARVAERRVRESRQGDFEFYNPEQWEQGRQIAELISKLPAAIKSGAIYVWYQPQVNNETGEILGAEALCRWDHDMLGWLRPSGFIPVLEESGLIIDLDHFVWDRVCSDLQRWNQQGHHRTVSVNLSRCDIQRDRSIAEYFNDLIKKYGLTADQLHIEITETAYAEDPELLIRTTEELKENGFRVEMDDFGSGYSSLNMLKEVPVDRIKLDLRFLTDSGDPEKCRIIISYMIKMAHALGMDMIAEGVETEAQVEFLQSKGCSMMQGFWFYKPMPAREIEMLSDWK